MSTINNTRPKRSYTTKAHKNFMGGPSYDINDPIMKLRIAASSCFFGEPDYYHTKREKSVTRPSFMSYLRETLGFVTTDNWGGLTPRQILENAIDEALTHDPEETLKLAEELRHEGKIRVTPQVIMVRAAMHPNVKGTGLLKKYASILNRADEPATQLAYYLCQPTNKGKTNKKIPNALKRIWREFLAGCDEYQLSKYRLENREVKTIDVINLVHPKRTAAINALAKGELKQSRTWESIVTKKGDPDQWREAIPNMGHMALLRNIRNMNKAGVKPDEYLEKLVRTAERGRQLPFRYWSAYRNCQDAGPKVLNGIETCLECSIGNLPHFDGRVMSLCDNSGSATRTTASELGTVAVNEIANLMGVITGKISDEGFIGIFGDRLQSIPITRKGSIFTFLNKANTIGNSIGGSTENGIWLFWDKAIREKEHWDHIFVYSDMQAGHGGLYGINSSNYRDYIWTGGSSGVRRLTGGHQYIDVPKLIAEYRKKVNKNVFVYLVQVAGYQDTLIPEYFDRTFILGGWSGSIINYAAAMSNMYNQIHNK